MMSLSSVILKRVKSICNERNITTHKLAVLSGVTESTIRYFMNGSVNAPRIDTLYKIATGLGMTLSEFFDFPEMNDIDLNDQ